PKVQAVSNSRREFLISSAAAVLGSTAAACDQSASHSIGQKTQQTPVGTPPAFGTAPAVGPEVDAGTFAAAEKLVQVNLTGAQRAMAARSWRNSMAALYERRVGPRKVELNPTLAPFSTWNPVLSDHSTGPRQNRFMRSGRDPGAVPTADGHIALAPLWKLSRW